MDAAIARAHERFGRLDVSRRACANGNQLLRRTLWVTQAALPIMRAQRAGRIIQVSSIGGVNAFDRTRRLCNGLGWPIREAATELPAYGHTRTRMAAWRKNNVPGDPDATAGAILKIVDALEPPLRIFFGSSGLPMTRAEYAKRMETWEQWNDLSLEAQGDSAGKRA